MTINKILIIGGSGLLGSCFKKKFPQKSFSIGRSINNDFVIKKNIQETLNNIANPNDLIIHAAWDINLRNWESNNNLENYFKEFSNDIFEFSNSSKINCIFISTDQVYNGKGPHVENKISLPLNKYGKVKLDCEDMALKNNVSVARLNFLSRDPNNINRGWVENLIKKTRNNEKIILYDNVYFSPCSGYKAAEIIYKLGQKNYNDKFNIGCIDNFAKSDIALEIFKYLDIKYKNIIIEKVDKFPDNINREKDLSMDVNKLEKKLNLNLENKDQLIKNIFK